MNVNAYRWQTLGLLMAGVIAGYVWAHRETMFAPAKTATADVALARSSVGHSGTPTKSKVRNLSDRLVKFANRFEDQSRVDPEGALASVAGLPEPFAAAAIDAWTSVHVASAAEAVRLVQSLPNGDLQLTVLRQLVRKLGPLALASADHSNVIAVATRLLSEKAVLELLKEGIAEANLDSAILSFSSRGVMEGDGRAFLMQLARWNPREAAAISSHILNSNQLHLGIAELAHVWMRADPDGAIEWLQSLDSDLRAKVMLPLAESVSANNPHAIAALAQSIPADQLEPGSVAKMAGRWAGIDPEMATRWLASMTNVSVQTLAESLGGAISEPAVAEAYLKNLGHLQPPDGFADALSRAAFRDMTADQVLQWSQTLSNATTRQATMVAGLMKGAQGDPGFINQNVAAWLPDDPESKEKFLSLLGARWITEDFEGAWNWLQENAASAKSPIPDALAAALKSEQLDLKRVSQLTLDWFAKQSSESLNSPSSIAAANALSAESFQQIGKPADVANLLISLPEGPAKESALLSLAKNATLADPYSASEWISTMLPGSFKDKAVESLVRAIPNDPEKALLWAATIGDSASRVQLVHDAYTELWSIDPALATRTVQQSQLSSDDILKLQQKLR